ncbi:phage tail protein I [Burkholderia gladioli]|uniref:phage tail protein I n=1 Tax=Burkholderia gladioli TaxID=28095 RepID=UPI00163F6311|nr:phage tail protein I [Burkholderia gladioli]
MLDALHLLPPNATPLEQRLAQACAVIERVPVPTRDAWNPATCPVALLPWMAWGFGVDQWDNEWTEDQKRTAIAQALYVQKHKGTIGAVRTAVATLGYDVEIQEWFNQIPASAPYTFDVIVHGDQVGVDQAAMERILYVVRLFKNLRSHIAQVRTTLTTRANLITAGVVKVGNTITIPYDGTALSERTLDGSWTLDGTVNLSGVKI